MKSFALLLALAIASLAHAAGTIVAEPKSPPISETPFICSKIATGDITFSQFLRPIEVDGKKVREFTNVTYLNGKKIFQREEVGEGPSTTITLYVRDTKQNNWRKYVDGKDDNPKERHELYLAALGLSVAEYEKLLISKNCFASAGSK